MFQIYLLTVLVNCLAGFIIAGSFFRDKQELCGSFLDLFSAPNAKLSVALVTLLVGIISLFKVSPTDIVFIGDLLPSAGAIIGGLVLGSYALSEKMEEPPRLVAFLMNVTDAISTPLGLVIMIIGLLHAIIPTAVIL
ncbi:MAG: hypothetical protein PQJ59_01905 [Spirochaetales bacterium]|nr:hypothetical protein [Spirochaetales bacterium]